MVIISCLSLRPTCVSINNLYYGPIPGDLYTVLPRAVAVRLNPPDVPEPLNAQEEGERDASHAPGQWRITRTFNKLISN